MLGRDVNWRSGHEQFAQWLCFIVAGGEATVDHVVTLPQITCILSYSREDQRSMTADAILAPRIGKFEPAKLLLYPCPTSCYSASATGVASRACDTRYSNQRYVNHPTHLTKYFDPIVRSEVEVEARRRYFEKSDSAVTAERKPVFIDNRHGLVPV